MTRLLSAFLSLLVVLTAANATSIRPLAVEELVANATDIVEGRAVASWTEWNADHTLIFTYTRFEVSKTLKGSAGPAITIKQLGGSDGVLTQKVSGVRHFSSGETALLFLAPADRADARFVVGLMQGNFRTQRAASGEWLASNGLPAAYVMRGQQVANAGSATTVRLADLESRIRKAVTK